MRTGFTKFGVAVVLVVQLVAVAMLIRLGSGYEKIFADFNTTLPMTTVVALKLTQPIVLVPIAAATSLMVIAAELRVKSDNARLITQLVTLSFWMMLACYCMIAILLPFFDLVAKLS